MIIGDNFRLQFYDAIKNGHNLVVANTDVDALCAAAILTHIFSCDDVAYSLSPVDSFSMLESAINSHKDQAKNVILINCVGSRSLREIVDLPDNINIWLLESRRPIHVNNVYDRDVIRVLAYNEEIANWGLPETSDIYTPEQSDESEDEEEEGQSEEEEEEELDDEDEQENQDPRDGRRNKRRSSSSAASHRPTKKRRREDLVTAIEKRAIRRHQREKWRRNRGNILWDYYKKSWYSHSISMLMLELAHQLGKSSAELMWCAVVGLSSQYTDNLISVEALAEVCMQQMRPFIRKFGPRAGTSLEQTKGDDQLRINFDKELTLPLYSHWTLYESMTNDPTFICQSKLWQQRGEDRFKGILAQLGLTLAECTQNHEVLKKERRKEVFEILLKHLNSGFYSFTSHVGYSTSFSASDFARILSLQLEYKSPLQSATAAGDPEQLCCERYNRASRILCEFFKIGGTGLRPLNRAISDYKNALQTLNELVKRSIVQNHVIAASRYFVINLDQQCRALSYFSSRHCLFLFTNSILLAFSTGKMSRRTKPLIVCVPMLGADTGWLLICGVMPLGEQLANVDRKSIIGHAFRQVAKENIGIRFTFDSNVIMIKKETRIRFFSHLETLFE